MKNLKYQSDAIEEYFTRSDGQYIFARWGRPIAPVVFGVQDKTLVTLKTAIQSLTIIANHEMAETDPELGSNAMFFFFLSWDELLEVKLTDGTNHIILASKEGKSIRFNERDVRPMGRTATGVKG
ncbi:MAG: DNA gyrase C-terminal beta-propeller domain-containing protein, partial [Paracoccaceae bacterium]